jgi:hypothetical protein
LGPEEAHVFLSAKGLLPLFSIGGNVWRSQCWPDGSFATIA